MSDLRKVNRDLKDRFGTAPMDALGRGHFRLAMTTQLEKRIGSVTRFTEGGVYLGVDSGVHTIPKYNFAGHYDEPKWVLERLMFAPLPEVPDTLGGSYEPVHVFPHIDGHPIMPTIDILSLFINLLLFGPKKTAQDYVYEDEKKLKREIAHNLDVLKDNNSYMQGQFKAGEAVSVANNFEGKSPLLKETKEATK